MHLTILRAHCKHILIWNVKASAIRVRKTGAKSHHHYHHHDQCWIDWKFLEQLSLFEWGLCSSLQSTSWQSWLSHCKFISRFPKRAKKKITVGCVNFPIFLLCLVFNFHCDMIIRVKIPHRVDCCTMKWERKTTSCYIQTHKYEWLQ